MGKYLSLYAIALLLISAQNRCSHTPTDIPEGYQGIFLSNERYEEGTICVTPDGNKQNATFLTTTQFLSNLQDTERQKPKFIPLANSLVLYWFTTNQKVDKKNYAYSAIPAKKIDSFYHLLETAEGYYYLTPTTMQELRSTIATYVSNPSDIPKKQEIDECIQLEIYRNLPNSEIKKLDASVFSAQDIQPPQKTAPEDGDIQSLQKTTGEQDYLDNSKQIDIPEQPQPPSNNLQAIGGFIALVVSLTGVGYWYWHNYTHHTRNTPAPL